MKRITGALLVAGVLVAGAVGCDRWDENHKTVSYEVPGQVTELVLDGKVGGIEVIASDGPVRVIEKQGWRDQEPNATHTLEGGVLKLAYSCSDCGIGYQVRVPAGTKLRLTEDTGGIKLVDMAGEIDARADTGGIQATGLRAQQVKLTVQTGGIQARFAVAPASAELRTDTGGVDLAVPGGADYQVDAHAESGGSDSSVPSQAGATHKLVARAGSGGVRVHTG
ncbi:DUF4097 family beta strand repeat-containing protein [Kitasatospora sp. NPDC049285]|uniref:DUF4097 family beta strand repeat-containing protein n=1 Tax=Kitasatospora sp. NPDC049285 TaxID=3157096 RepID=UPI003415A5CE